MADSIATKYRAMLTEAASKEDRMDKVFGDAYDMLKKEKGEVVSKRMTKELAQRYKGKTIFVHYDGENENRGPYTDVKIEVKVNRYPPSEKDRKLGHEKGSSWIGVYFDGKTESGKRETYKLGDSDYVTIV